MERTPDHQPAYRRLIDDLKRAFPQPVSDPVHDAYFVFSILRALDQVDDLKSQTPILGTPSPPDFAAARLAAMTTEGRSLEEVTRELVNRLQGMFIWQHPQSQINVVPHPSIASIIGVLLPSIYNPNLCSEESGGLISEAEEQVVAMVSGLVGYDPARSAGAFTFGGTGGLLYGLKIGLEKAQPGCRFTGVHGNAVVLASDKSHYACLTTASWLGIGQQNVNRVATAEDNSIQIPRLAEQAREQIAAGKRIAAIVATMGTTDSFGIDDLQAIQQLRDRLVDEFRLDYRPHIHADAVIGWAWSVFNDYDFGSNPLGFRGRTVRALAAAHHDIRHLRLADSIGIDFHKTGYTPYISSLFLVREQDDLGLIARSKETMPYLYQTGTHHPGMYTLETTRGGTGPMAALANLLLLGKVGYRALLGHAVEMAEVLREKIESHPDITVLNGSNVGPVTLFRVYPHGVDTFEIKDQERGDAQFREQLLKYNDYNRRIFHRVHDEAVAGDGVVISLTDCYRLTDYDEPIVALKSYVLSPFSDERRMESIIEHVLDARREVEAEDAARPRPPTPDP